ncbi:MAG: winged helix DNA-binding domain-containing protein [Chloroflexota bacterium]
MAARPHVSTAQRRARVAQRHAIAPGTQVGTLAEAADLMTALHGTDNTSVYLQAQARLRDSSIASIGGDLYDQPTVLRLLAMRRTLFVVPLSEVATLHHAASLDIAAKERASNLRMFEAGGVGPDTAALFRELEDLGLAAIREQGEATTAELAALDPRLGQRITIARGKSYEGSISVAQRVFLLLAVDGRIGRGRPRGTWKGTQVRWSPIERWLPDGIPPMVVDEARARLVGHWLRTFGPGTREDLRWWTGWTVAAVRAALVANHAVEVGLDDGATGWLLPHDVDLVPEPAPWVALLPALDATTMGWSERDWYLGPHRPRVFDSVGNGGPTIWVDGRIVGGWAQRPDGEIALRLLEDVGAEGRAAIDAAAGRLQAWLGPERFRTVFSAPLEIDLRDG